MAYMGNQYYANPTAGYGTGTPVYNGPVYQTPVNTNPGIVWVAGEEQARNYPIVPGNSLLLMDINNLVLYSKSSDSSGRVSMTIYDLIERKPVVKVDPNSSEFVKKDELEAIIASAVDKAIKNSRKSYKKYDKDSREVSSNE